MSSERQVRQRVVAGAADMIRRKGPTAMSVRDLATYAGAPLGSTYHYFPGGKRQLVTEAVQFAGDLAARDLRAALEAGPVEGLDAFLGAWRRVVVGSDFRAGCPVLAVAVAEPDTEDLSALDAAAAAFASWESMLASALRARGATRKQASQIATLVVAAVEGAVALCRAKRSAVPLDAVAAQLRAVITSALDASR